MSDIICRNKLTQVEAAKIMEIDQSKVSQLLSGKHRKFSLQEMIKFINLLGFDIDILIKTSTEAQGNISLTFNGVQNEC